MAGGRRHSPLPGAGRYREHFDRPVDRELVLTMETENLPFVVERLMRFGRVHQSVHHDGAGGEAGGVDDCRVPGGAWQTGLSAKVSTGAFKGTRPQARRRAAAIYGTTDLYRVATPWIRFVTVQDRDCRGIRSGHPTAETVFWDRRQRG